MKKILMMLGLAAASAVPLAASAHTDVHLGLNVDVPVYSYRVPAYYDYGAVIERPYCPPRAVVYESYYGRPYYRADYERPVIVYRERGGSHGWHDHGRWHR